MLAIEIHPLRQDEAEHIITATSTLPLLRMTGLYQEAALSQLYNQPAPSMSQKPLPHTHPKSVWGRRRKQSSGV